MTSVLLLSLSLWASGPTAGRDAFKDAEAAYDDFAFDKAIGLLQRLLKQDRFSDDLQKQRARLMLAFSLYIRGREPEAKRTLERLFAENVEYALDRKDTNPDLVRFFDREHDAYARSLGGVSPPKAAVNQVHPASVPARADANVTVTRQAQTTGDRHPWVRVFPLGIGHFLNHDHLAGGLFLGAEVGLAATNVAAALVNNGMKAGNGRYLAGTNPAPWRILQNVAAGVLIGVIVFEIIDAWVWSPARGRATLAAHPTVSLGLLGDYRVGWHTDGP